MDALILIGIIVIISKIDSRGSRQTPSIGKCKQPTYPAPDSPYKKVNTKK